MAEAADVANKLEPIYASDGVGPLLQRDYSGIIEGSPASPEDLVELVHTRFESFAPRQTAVFNRCDEATGPLEPGSEMDIHIKMVGHCRVRVAHRDHLSLTLRTLKGHPEAGRITFAASRDDQGRLLFQIRSRTRASGPGSLFGFLLLGKQMQARTWIRFIWNVAEACGGRVVGSVKVRTTRVEERDSDREGLDAPTLSPRGVG